MKCVLEAKTSQKHLNIVSEGKYGTCTTFSVFKDFSMSPFEKVLQKRLERRLKFGLLKGLLQEENFQSVF